LLWCVCLADVLPLAYCTSVVFQRDRMAVSQYLQSSSHSPDARSEYHTASIRHGSECLSRRFPSHDQI
jgi:hypothetical protein